LTDKILALAAYQGNRLTKQVFLRQQELAASPWIRIAVVHLLALWLHSTLEAYQIGWARSFGGRCFLAKIE